MFCNDIFECYCFNIYMCYYFLHQVIFKIVEDHPKDVSRDIENISIVYGDESLPRLYENSRVSSDQLPGQPGTVNHTEKFEILIVLFLSLIC